MKEMITEKRHDEIDVLKRKSGRKELVRKKGKSDNREWAFDFLKIRCTRPDDDVSETN